MVYCFQYSYRKVVNEKHQALLVLGSPSGFVCVCVECWRYQWVPAWLVEFLVHLDEPRAPRSPYIPLARLSTPDDLAAPCQRQRPHVTLLFCTIYSACARNGGAGQEFRPKFICHLAAEKNAERSNIKPQTFQFGCAHGARKMEDVALIRSDKVIWGGTMGSQGSPLWSFCAQAPGGQIWASTRHERTGSRHKKCLTHVWIYVWISYNQVIINIIRNLKGTYITIWRELCRAFSQFASKMLHWPWPLRSKAQGVHPWNHGIHAGKLKETGHIRQSSFWTREAMLRFLGTLVL